MNLYFIDSKRKEEILLGKDLSREEAFSIIRDFCNKRNFKIFYFKERCCDSGYTYDYGNQFKVFKLLNEN